MIVLGRRLGMIHFYEELVQFALKLIDVKSTQDDIKASIDLNEINLALNNASLSQEFIDYAIKLHKRIKKDYPEIDEMHTVASKMRSALGMGMGNEITQSEYDDVLSNLNSDMYGILASVLLKHEKVSCIKEFIKSVD